MKITQRIEFECCYVADSTLNAHTYKLEVAVSGHSRYLETGYVLKFEDFKRYLHQVVPHNTYIYSTKSLKSVADAGECLANCGVPVICTDSNVSCEWLCDKIANDLQSLLYVEEPGIAVQSVKLREGSDSFASWGE